MPALTLVQVMAARDGLTLSDVEERIKDMISAVEDGADPEEVLYEEGLEPDYVMDLMGAMSCGSCLK